MLPVGKNMVLILQSLKSLEAKVPSIHLASYTTFWLKGRLIKHVYELENLGSSQGWKGKWNLTTSHIIFRVQAKHVGNTTSLMPESSSQQTEYS